ncbi:LysR family transcriptional regulator [Cohnella lubricantis]|uniref:LysR family transcriptional regulator n=1 Tax=Cohnella lubricantis TaxID=2163172 RepID=A0A841T649_9BACL|nr:LysR family transcriptional regulator [Cohnella lubricantis]MBB6676362.1 LysR family transcriptional regulator [Cohnella lubricantis]
MSIARFEIFSKVIELGSFTKAAEKLNMTQSAVSHAVAGLESDWGITLLIRDRKNGLILTEVGQKTLISIREILNQMEKIKQEVAFASNLEVGTIRIGSFSSASSCLLPKMVAKFHQKHPNIEFIFFEGTYEEIREWIETGVVDIGFVVQPTLETNLHIVPVIKDQMVVAFPDGHHFQKKETIDAQDIQEEPFIMPKGVYRTHVEEIFNQANIKPQIRFEVQDCNTIVNMVQEGLGITIGPELFLKNQTKIKTRNLKRIKWRSIALACPSIQGASPAVQEFLTVAQGIFTKENN